MRNVKADYKSLSDRFNVSKLICKILLNRNIYDHDHIDMFINPDLGKLHNPRLMKDMEKGVCIIKESILKGHSIRICGDYDQDGNSSILTLYNGLKRCGAKVDYVIPHRIEDGYGINNRIIEEAKSEGIDVIITCDNAISAIDPIIYAKQLGLKVIITDHHDIPYLTNHLGEREYFLPDADAVINPKRKDCNYPFKELCGAGVAFKFIQVLYEEMDIDPKEAYDLLEYVAMGTVCDVVDLVDENRIIVKEGLKKINNTKNEGLKALIKVTGCDNREITSYSLGYIIGPCINASGRLESADTAVELFTVNDSQKALEYALRLHKLNEERKAMTSKGYDKVLEQIEQKNMSDQKILVIYEPEIHESIAGIIAGKIKDRYYKPVIILTDSTEEGIAKGSARSVEELNIYEEISKQRNLLIKFGGHPMAAGLSLLKKNIDEFNGSINSFELEEGFIPKVYIDSRLPLNNVTIKLVEELKLLEPHGKGNDRPLFAEKEVCIKELKIIGKDKNVIRLKLYTKTSNHITGVYFGDIQQFKNYIADKFGITELENAMTGKDNNIRLDIAFIPSINEYNGSRYIQAIIHNYR